MREKSYILLGKIAEAFADAVLSAALFVMADIHVNVTRGSMNVSLFGDTERNDVSVSKHNFRIADCPIPTPSSLVPSCFFIDPGFGLDTIDNSRAFAKWLSYRGYNFRRTHSG